MVRLYKATDYDQISRINKECFPQPCPDNILLAEIQEGKCWVYEYEGKVVGFLVTTFKTRCPYIYNVAVIPSLQKKGIATALITTFENHFYNNKYYRVWLQVDSSNPAQMLYFHLGYKIEDVTKNYYGNGKDALHMFKQL